MKLKLFVRALLFTAFLNLAASLPAADLDEDGLDDTLEAMLIDRHRPHLYYDHREDDWPSSVLWFVQHSELTVGGDNVLVVSRSELEANPLRILDFASRTKNPSGSDYHINIANESRSGEGPSPVGMYAHVVPLTGTVKYSDRPELPVGPDDLLIQYWQFFPFSDSQAPFSLGDHEGDWLYLDVFVTRQPPHTLRYIVYHHHGDGNCAPDVVPGNSSTLDAIGGIVQQFVPLPADGIPRAYLDEGSHEWWALPCDSDDCDCFGADPHDGRGVNYRAENILNLGEAFAPMPGSEPQLVLFFNGTWGQYGDSPRGPVLQFYPSSPLLLGYVDPSASAWTQAGLGSRYHPFTGVGPAKSEVETTLNVFARHAVSGTLRLRAGNYAGNHTFDKPMTLELWGDGVATIGQ